LAKSGSFGFAKGRLVRGAKPNVPLAGWLKLFLKNAGGKKIKNTGSAMSVGLLVVRLKYGLYVVQLSKWFVLVFNVQFLVVCFMVALSFYTCR
jgi:hypothetical protein